MNCIVKREFIFIEPGRDKLRVHPSPTPQCLPDWIRKTRLFELAESDGSIYELKSAPARAARAAAVPPPVEENSGLESDDAKPRKSRATK